MYGLVLAGGGARGAYEVGAWRAINAMGLEISAICGTSIGSINGAAFAQGDADKAEKLWRSISVSDVLDMSSFPADKLLSIKNIAAVFEEFKKNKGVSMQPLEYILREIIDEEKLLNSPIDFGLVTYSLTDLSETAVFKRDIPKGKLIDYLMASACMPGIKTKIIGEKAFIDGCVADNKPVGMLIDRGFRDIIAVDVGGYGIVKPVKNSGINLFEVKCETPEVGVMQFEQKRIARSIQSGYLDTKRAFGQLCGKKYAFRAADYIRERRRLSAELIEGLETAAEMLGVDKLREYTVESLARKVCESYRNIISEYNGITVEMLAGRKEKNKSVLLANAAKWNMTGEADIFNSKIVGNMFKDFIHAINALSYFLKRAEL